MNPLWLLRRIPIVFIKLRPKNKNISFIHNLLSLNNCCISILTVSFSSSFKQCEAWLLQRLAKFVEYDFNNLPYFFRNVYKNMVTISLWIFIIFTVVSDSMLLKSNITFCLKIIPKIAYTISGKNTGYLM